MAAVDDVGTYLASGGVGVQGTNLFLYSMPDEPDTCACVYQYPGNAPEYVQNSNTPIAEMPQIQFVARAKNAADAEAMAYLAWELLSAIVNADLSGTHYRSVKPDGSPGVMRRDSNDRIYLYFNAAVDKEVSLASIS